MPGIRYCRLPSGVRHPCLTPGAYFFEWQRNCAVMYLATNPNGISLQKMAKLQIRQECLTPGVGVSEARRASHPEGDLECRG